MQSIRPNEEEPRHVHQEEDSQEVESECLGVSYLCSHTDIARMMTTLMLRRRLPRPRSVSVRRRLMKRMATRNPPQRSVQRRAPPLPKTKRTKLHLLRNPGSRRRPQTNLRRMRRLQQHQGRAPKPRRQLMTMIPRQTSQLLLRRRRKRAPSQARRLSTTTKTRVHRQRRPPSHASLSRRRKCCLTM